MAAKWIEVLTGSLEEKKQFRQYKARAKALPTSYRTAIEGLERFFMYAGGVSQGDVLVTMLDDLVVLFEQAAADGTPVSAIVGDDPVEFAETFLSNYSEGQWLKKERARLTETIARAENEDAGND